METRVLPPLALPDAEDASVLGVLRSPGSLVRECLAGVITALALVPEVISFSVVAGVDPKVSLIASVVLGLVMSLFGGRPAMVTAAAGSVALVIGPTVRAHGVNYVVPIVVLAALVQVAFGLAGLARFARHIPRPVLNGFVTALGILIFWAQLPHVLHHSGAVIGLFALTLLVMHFAPRFTQAVPAPLIAIGLDTALAAAANLQLPTVGAGSSLETGLPGFSAWLVPLNLTTLSIIWPAALSVAFVGLLETLLTAQLVDEMTDTPSNKTRESWSLGVANLCAAFYGGIGGCAMIGQTVVNVQIGRARTRVSTSAAALVLLILVTGLSGLLARIPMVALASVMMVVAVKTVNWSDLRPSRLRAAPFTPTAAMLATVAATVWTQNLALGVLSGLVVAGAASLLTRWRERPSTATPASASPAAVKYLDDPRVFFAAERTLLAWQRTAIAIIGLAFVIERSSTFVHLVSTPATAGQEVATLILACVLLAMGVGVLLLSTRQYTRFVLQLSGPELPRRHHTWLGPATNLLLSVAALVLMFWFIVSH